MGDRVQNIKELKATIEEKTNQCNQVFIVAHNNADFDAIASAIGLSHIIKKLGKNAYIILNEDPTKIEPGVKRIIEEINQVVNIISVEDYINLKSSNDLLITVDVNKEHMVCCKDYLNSFKEKILIDHHHTDENTIKTPHQYVKPELSSASEIITEMLCMYRIKITPELANYLLAGIYLDTNKYTKKSCTSKTMSIVSKLLDKGGDIAKVNEFFEEDFNSDRKVQELVNKANFFTYSIALCIADENVIYTKEELAKVADYLLRYKADAAFAAGFIDENLISISARSKGKIDVGTIMSKLSGGGNTYSAATKIADNKILNPVQKLVKIIKPTFYKEEKN